MGHSFYDEYYFRPKAAWRIVRKSIFNNTERKRLYKEAKSYMSLRSARNKATKDMVAAKQTCCGKDPQG